MVLDVIENDDDRARFVVHKFRNINNDKEFKQKNGDNDE